jgi:hypothetical protein
MIAASVEAITGAPFVPLRGRTAGGPVLALWYALGKPDPDAHAEDMALVADAAQRCPERLFAHDIRAVGWPDGTDRSRSPHTLCVQKRWDERLAAAKAWDARGRPTIQAPEVAARERQDRPPTRKSLLNLFNGDLQNATST